MLWPGKDRNAGLALFTLKTEQGAASRSVLYPQSYANAKLEDPEIKVHSFQACGNCTCFEAEAARPAAWVAFDTALPGRFSMNSMALVPNRVENISFCGWEQVSPADVAQSVTVMSVFDAQRG